MSWPTKKLGEVFDIARGGSPRPIKDYISDAPDAVNWISIKDASESGKYIKRTKLKIRKEGISRSRMVKSGDFLLTNSMSFGRPYIMATDGCIHDGWLVLSSQKSQVDQNYFYHLLSSHTVYAKFKKLAAGAVVKNLNIDLVRGVEIPLPPLKEQQRIAAILDKADEIRRKREQAIALTDELLRSAFLEMFGDPVTNPMGWPEYQLESLLSDIQGGWSPTCDARPADNDEWGVLKLGAVTQCKYVDTENKALVEAEPKANLEVHVGDVLFTRKNTYALVAACALVRETRSRLMFPDLVFRLRIADTARLKPEYLWGVLSHPGKRACVQRLAGGTSGSMPNISKSKLREEKIPIPNIETQRRFADLVDSLAESTRSLRNHQQTHEYLVGSLTQAAFRGEL